MGKPELTFATLFETDDVDSIDESTKTVTVGVQTFQYSKMTMVTILDDPGNPETSTTSEYYHFELTQTQIDSLHPSLRRFFGGAPGLTKNANNGPAHVFGHCIVEPQEKVGGGNEGIFTTPDGNSVTIDTP